MVGLKPSKRVVEIRLLSNIFKRKAHVVDLDLVKNLISVYRLWLLITNLEKLPGLRAYLEKLLGSERFFLIKQKVYHLLLVLTAK